MRTLNLTLAAGSMLLLALERAPAQTVPAQMIVTVEARHDKQSVPELKREDVLVFQKNERLRVTNLVRCRNENAALELYLLVDDASGENLGSQLNDLRQFVESLPEETSVGIGYMRNATVLMAQDLTTDHARAAKALRLPMGYPGAMPSPFLSLSELIKRWPANSARHEVVLVTSGVDPLGGAIANPYLDAAIKHAQRAGVIVYAIYTPNAGHFSHSFWRLNWGQNHLSQIAEETGGEAYMLGFGPPVSFGPYLKEVAERLAHQYVVTFQATPGDKAGLQTVRITTEVPNAELVVADKVYVPSGA